MRLSLIFELLLIFVLLAFAASRVIETKSGTKSFKEVHKSLKKKHPTIKNQRQTSSPANKYCSCSTKLCNCCREFNIPVVSLQGPGCASLQYMSGDRLAITMSFGERVLTNTTISGKRPRPVCMPLPGGVSKFCGRVYNIGRQGEDFKACLGLELRALDDIEASLRVSCFRFGPKGLKVDPAQPLPVVAQPVKNEDSDEDDDDDDYELDDDDGVDYESFSLLDDDFIGGFFGTDSESSPAKPVKKVTAKPPAKKVSYRKPATKPPQKLKKKPTRKVPLKTITSTTTVSKPEDNYLNKTSENDINPITPIVEMMSNESSQQLSILKDTKPTEVSMNEISQNDVTSSDVVQEQGNKTEQVSTGDDKNIMMSTTLMSISENQDVSTTVRTENEVTTEQSEEDSSEEDSSDEDDDEDPISSAVDEAISDEEEEEEEKNKDKNEEKVTTTEQPTPVKEKKNEVKHSEDNEEDDDDLDSVVDGMVDTVTGEDDDDSEEDEEDSKPSDAANDEDEDDDDDLSRRFNKDVTTQKSIKKFRSRQSKDMRLDRIHWQ